MSRGGEGDEYGGGGGIRGGAGARGNASGIVNCDVDEFCSGHATRCMQKGNRRKCKCLPGFEGDDCSAPLDPLPNENEEFGDTIYQEQTVRSNDGDSGGENNLANEVGVGVAEPPEEPTQAPDDHQEPTDFGGGGGGGGDVSSEQAKASDDDGDGGSGGGGDVDDNAGGLRHLPLPGPLGALPLDTQLKALGGIAGLLMFCILALCAKRRCSKASPPSSSSSSSSSLPPATEANNSNAASSVGGVSNDEGEQWDDDWDDEEGGNGAEQELTPMLGQRQETIPQQAPAQRSPSESNSRGNNALPGGLGSSRGGNTAHGGGGGLGSLRKPASKPKATSSASSALNDDYPPLVTEDANSLFADLGISAKPTFVKPIQPKSKKLAELGDQMGDSSANWGNGDDDGLDDI